MGRYWLGIDIGGTFTDFTLYDRRTRAITGLKVASTPPDFARAVEDGLDALAAEHHIDLREIDVAVHGTTIAVNTLIQRTGARLGLLVTEGFRDVLEIQRLRLPNPLDMHGGRFEPLIPRTRVAEVRERLRADGRVDTPLDEAGVAEAARRLAADGAEGLVISLIHAYRDPSHERRARAVAEAAAPGVAVSASHEVWPEAREYERTALAVLDAYVQPKVRRYLAGFEAALSARARPRGGARHQVQRRHHAGGGGAASDRVHPPVRAGLRRHRRRLRRRRRRIRQPDHARRRRDQRGHRGGGERPAALQHRRADRRHPGHDAGGGRHRHRRGRRIGGVGRRGGRAEGGPAEHRRQSRPGLLRARRQGGHALRRLPGVRLPRSGAVPRRADAPGPRRSPRRPSGASPIRSAWA